MTYPYITRNCVRNFVIFFFFISIRNSRHSETQIWLTNSFFFVCVVFGEFSIGKNQFFPVSFFFSLFQRCFLDDFWPFIARWFFARKKKQSSHYDVTLSHFQIDFFHFLDWIGGTAQLLISYNFFSKIFFLISWEQMKIVVTFFRLAFFQCVSDATYWVWNKSSDFFRTFFSQRKSMSWIVLLFCLKCFDTLFLTTRKEGSFFDFQQVPSMKYCKKCRLNFWFLEKSKTTFLISMILNVWL